MKINGSQRWFFLKDFASEWPPKPDFRRLRRQKCEKNAFLSTWKNDPKITFYNCGIRYPSKKFLPVSRRVPLFNGIPGALRTQQLSISASQLSVLVSWESLAEVSKGCNVPRTEKKFLVALFVPAVYAPFPPINFCAPVANWSKNCTDGKLL